MTTLPVFPPAVHRYVKSIFNKANRRVCEKLARVPNTSEPSLDMSLVDELSQYSGPQVVAPGWAVRIDIHFLGGLRHYRNWEIADVGVLVFAKQGASVVAKKTALLQSKRLYPNAGGVVEESLEDYRIGFGGLVPSHLSSRSLSLAHTFDFTKASRYKALKVDDQQYVSIAKYEKDEALDVFYLLYNPWRLDARYTFPLAGPQTLGLPGNAGCRVVPSTTLRTALLGKAEGYSPTFADVEVAMSSLSKGTAGWRIEHFMSNLLLKCKQGNLFESVDQENMFNLFNRRSGPIAAAVAVTVEQFAE